MRRTNSDGGGGVMGSVGGTGSVSPLTTSISFPSLSDTVLRQLGALMDDIKNKEENQSSEKEVESKFTSLMLAFKTDKLTLEQRTLVQERQRDQAEANIASELANIKTSIQLQVLSPIFTDSEKIELLENVNEQIDALHKAALRASSVSEMFGAVMQEKRLSRAVDIVMRHVENLKQAYEKEKAEHEETRRVLVESKVPTSAVLKLEGRTVSRARLGSLPRKLSNTIHEAEPEEVSIKDTSAGSSSSAASSPKGDVGEGSSSVRAIQRKSSSQSISEERRQSQSATGAESESDDDEGLLDANSDVETPAFPSTDTSPTTNTQQQMDLEDSWLTKMVDWLRPADQWLMRVRIAISLTLGVVALAIFFSTFIPKR